MKEDPDKWNKSNGTASLLAGKRGYLSASDEKDSSIRTHCLAQVSQNLHSSCSTGNWVAPQSRRWLLGMIGHFEPSTFSIFRVIVSCVKLEDVTMLDKATNFKFGPSVKVEDR